MPIYGLVGCRNGGSPAVSAVNCWLPGSALLAAAAAAASAAAVASAAACCLLRRHCSIMYTVTADEAGWQGFYESEQLSTQPKALELGHADGWVLAVDGMPEQSHCCQPIRSAIARSTCPHTQ